MPASCIIQKFTKTHLDLNNGNRGIHQEIFLKGAASFLLSLTYLAENIFKPWYAQLATCNITYNIGLSPIPFRVNFCTRQRLLNVKSNGFRCKLEIVFYRWFSKMRIENEHFKSNNSQNYFWNCFSHFKLIGIDWNPRKIYIFSGKYRRSIL